MKKFTVNVHYDAIATVTVLAETEDEEELVPFVGEDMDEDSLSDFGPETKTHWGEDSK